MRVLIVDPIATAGVETLARHAEVVNAPDSAPATVRRLAAGCDGLITRSKLPDDIFDAAPRLRAVAIHGTGTDLVPLESATARGVMVANLPGENAQSVAEHSLLAMLLLARNTIPIVSSLKTSTWDAARALGASAHEIAGMTLGIVGVGAIGSRANSSKRRERLMKHFDMTADEVDRLHGPIGLNLGGKTPPEIAVSILAEMTAVRHGASLQRADKGTVFAQSQDPFACSAVA